jgi:transposase
MQALKPAVIDTVYAAVQCLLPAHHPPMHPLGCHRPRIDDKTCFTGMVYRLALGCSWEDAGALAGVSQATLRRRRDEWLRAGVFDRLVAEAIAAYDRILGLDLTEVCVDGSQHKAPCGGQGTGPNPTDRGRKGYKWSIATDKAGIPLGWAIDGANRHDIPLLQPTLAFVEQTGLLDEIETIHLDRGYDANTVRDLLDDLDIHDAVIARKRPRGTTKHQGRLPAPLGLRWTVERTNSWLSNYGQLRRNTDRNPTHRLAQFALAITITITVKLISHARWLNRHCQPA